MHEAVSRHKPKAGRINKELTSLKFRAAQDFKKKKQMQIYATVLEVAGEQVIVEMPDHAPRKQIRGSVLGETRTNSSLVRRKNTAYGM
jgi:hypothetical protein